jgi:hypothetical protein
VKVGEETEATCGRCGTSRHVIIAMVGGKVAQVECGQCQSRHRLRGAKAEASAPKRAASGAPKRTGTGTVKRARTVVVRPLIAPDITRPTSSYRPVDRYAPADRIEHPTFGLGVVERILGPSKIQVWFSDGERVLVHGRAG